MDVRELFVEEAGYLLEPRGLDGGRRYGLFVCDWSFKLGCGTLLVDGGK
jgi:hypothetical protein